MRAYLALFIIAALAFILSALTIPMSFMGTAVDATAEYGTITNTLIRFIWGWGLYLTSNTELSEPWAEILMHGINFCIFFCVLYLGYSAYRFVC